MDIQTQIQEKTLREFIKKHYQTNQHFAAVMGVTPASVSSYINHDRASMLKLLPKLVERHGKNQVAALYFLIMNEQNQQP